MVKNNGFNPVWEQQLCLPFDLVGDMRDLVFVRFSVRQEDKDDDEPLAVYCASLGSLNSGASREFLWLLLFLLLSLLFLSRSGREGHDR